MTTQTIEEMRKDWNKLYDEYQTWWLAQPDRTTDMALWLAWRLASALEQLEAKDQERKSDEAIHQAQDANLVAENKRLLEQLETANHKLGAYGAIYGPMQVLDYLPPAPEVKDVPGPK